MGERVAGLVLADQQQALAEGLGIILDATDGFAVLGVACNASRAVQLVAAHRPTVLLLDAHLPGGDPVETLAAVKAASPATKVLILLAVAPGSTAAAAVADGAHGLVAKNVSSRQLVSAIRTVINGTWVTVVGSQPTRAGQDPSMEVLRLGTLSAREREILVLLAQGWSTRRIAEGWQVAECTVRTHVQNLLDKLDVHSRVEAVAFALAHGMVAAHRAAPGKRHSAGR